MKTNSLSPLLICIGMTTLLVSFQNCSRDSFDPNNSDDVSIAGILTGDAATGQRIYTTNCQSCHGALEASTIRGAKVATMRAAFISVPEMIPSNFRFSDAEMAGLEKYLEYADTGWDKIESCSPSVETTDLGLITNSEYQNLLRDIFNVPQATLDALDLPAEDVGGELSFDNEASLQHLSGNLGKFFVASYDLAEDIVNTKYPASVCGADTPEICARKQLQTAGLYAYRRPVSTAEINRLMALYTSGTDFASGMKKGIRGILTSGRFLTRTQFGSGQLDGYDVAARLAFFIWRSAPDQALMQKAADGSILQDSVLKSEIDRLLADDRSVAYENDFVAQWLDTKELMDSSVALERDYFKETQTFFREIRKGTNPVNDVMTAKYAYINSALATIYGISGVTATAFNKVTIPANLPRKGVVTQASLLTRTSGAGRTSPVKRGIYMRNKFLCLSIGEPPDDAGSLNEDDLGSMSIRQAMAQHEQRSTTCAGCHTKIDPYGWPLEFYGINAKYRTQYPGGFVVDGSSNLDEIRGGRINDAMDFTAALDRNLVYKSCVIEKQVRFATYRSLTEAEKCNVRNMTRRLFGNGASVKQVDIIKEIVTSPIFKGI